MSDLIFLERYIVDNGYKEDGYAVKVNPSACDVNADGQISIIDAIMLARYIADGYTCNPNGYNAELLPAPFQCSHASVKHVEAVEAESCQKDGNIEYWYCPDCDKYFEDEACEHEISKEDTIVKGEHTVVVDPAVAPTADETGLTEGAHCSVCGEILKEQEVVPKLKAQGDYSITYNVVGSDTYLARQEIDNPNPQSYSAGDEIRLKELEVPGYIFEGWYDGQSANANRLTTIKADEYGDVKLYAHWSQEHYTITLDNDKTLSHFQPEYTSIEYTVNKETALPILSLNGYYFIGWANDDGKLVKKIEEGTIGHITLHPVWTSHRNSTHPNDYAAEGAAAITEWNDDNGNANISFVYNIGTIENVPLYTIGEWMYSNGIKTTKIETTSQSFSNECAQNFVKAVSEATTNSTSWTLSKEWSDTMEIDTSVNKNVTQEQIEAAQTYQENTGTWCISSGTGGNQDISITDGRSSKVAYTTDGRVESGVEAGVSADGVGLKANMKASMGYSDTDEYGATFETARSKSSYWNSDESHSQSSTSGQSDSFTNAISNSLSTSEHYGKLISESLGNSSTNTSEQYQSSENSYSNTFVYTTEEVKSETVEYTNQDAPDGYYRRVLVGTAYVFAVVILILLIPVDKVYWNLVAVGGVEDCIRRQSASPIVAREAGAPLNSNFYWSLGE